MTTQPAGQDAAAADGDAHRSEGRRKTAPVPEPESEATTAPEPAPRKPGEPYEPREPREPREPQEPAVPAVPAVRAVGLGLEGPQGTVFSGIGFEAPPGSLVAVEGPSSSGRTCLLLALTGRMRASEGHALVHGHRLPKELAAVRRISAVTNVPGVTDLEQSHSVAQHLREQALMQRRFGGPSRRRPLRPRELFVPRAERAAADRDRVRAALAAAGLDPEALPKGSRTRVRDLDRLDRLRLSVALALMGEPRLLGVDDADLALRGPEREQAWELLRSVAASGVTVLAVCGEAPEGALVVRTGAHGDTADDRRNDDTSSEETADACAETGRA